MFSFRKNIHKISAIPGANISASCQSNFVTAGTAEGIYEININYGSETGVVYIIYEAYGKVDRFEVEYDGTIVADTKFVGYDLQGSPPDTSPVSIIGTYPNKSIFVWDGLSFVDTGNTTTLTVTQSDIANGTTEPTEGAGIISFTKNQAGVTTAKIIVTTDPRPTSGFKIYTYCIDKDIQPILLGVGANSVDACNNNPIDNEIPALDITDIYFIDSSSTLVTTLNLYTDETATVSAPSGFYSDGTDWIEWNGSSIISNGNC